MNGWPLASAAVFAGLLALALTVAGCGESERKVQRNDQGVVGKTFSGLKVEVPDRPVSVAAGDGRVWATSMAGSVLTEIDPVSGKAIGEPVFTEAAPYNVEVAFGKVWVAAFENDYVVRVDPRTRRVIDRIKVGNRPFGMAAGFGYMWVTSIRRQTVSRLDPATGERVGEPIRLSGVPYQVVAAFGHVWVTNIRDGVIDRIDPHSGRRVGDPVRAGSFPAAIAAGGRYLWVANVRGSGTADGEVPKGDVWRIDPRSGHRVGPPIPVPQRPHALAANDRDVWVASIDADAITHIDARTGRRDKLPLLVGNAPGSLAIVPDGPRAGDVWVALAREDVVARVERSR